jgi:hypothetical protein
MPGREDLIKENNARAYAAANTPQPQESAGKSVSSSVGGPRSLLGGNLDVFSALDKVEFQGSLGDGSLRGNVAYIRMWKRGGSAQQAASTQQTVEPPKSDTLQILQEDLEAAIGNRDNVTNGFNPYEDVDNPIEVAEANIQIAENRLSEEKQKAISTQTPTSSKVASTTAIAVPQSAKTTTPSTPSVGAVKSANPSGFLNTLTNRGDGVGLPQGKVKYSGKLTENSSSATGKALGEMMWQFLFNPSELELDVGPEFKDAETWGVSDKGNSGKPLHWSHNKNAQLKFNSVLLNGFVFGRKVEALEQGLIELFMAREGEGQHGPHVLEFVWGKRVFGPCVIKNVNIKEKMWDEGEVVNAEVSFTLEQVPEWTINDGFVDVARPGRLQLATNPVAGANAPTDTAAAPNGSPDPNPSAGKSGSQKPAETPQTIVDQCKAIISDQKYIQTLITDVSSKLEGIEGLVYGPFGILRTDNTSVFIKNAGYYRRVFEKYSRNSLYKSSMTAGTLGANCADISPIVYSWRNSGNALVRQKDKVANQQLLICYRNIKSVMDKKAKEGKCSNFATPTDGKSGPGLF